MKTLNEEQYLELEKLHLNVFSPLSGFMDQEQYSSVVKRGRLPGGEVFTLPVVLDFSEEEVATFKGEKKIDLLYQDKIVGAFFLRDFYRPNKNEDAKMIYGTDDASHPGVADFMGLGAFFGGGDIILTQRALFEFSEFELTPDQTKSYFLKQGWKKIVGFQTRNVPHRAHEYLQKVALEICDGIFIQPLVGKKKKGDFNPKAVLQGYQVLTKEFFPAERFLLGVLSTKMRYAGPREAIFHALIRKNYGCTHFIIGRDHAGVGNYYGKYEAHEFAKKYSDQLGIELFLMKGPYFCIKCAGIVTEKTCPHDANSEYHLEISGTMIRKFLVKKGSVDTRVIRPEIIEVLGPEGIFL